MSSPRFNSVEEYLASLDPTKERTLRSVIEYVRNCVPAPPPNTSLDRSGGSSFLKYLCSGSVAYFRRA